MECQLEADPSPTIVWSHSGEVIASSSRVEQTLKNLGGVSYKATLVIRVSSGYEPPQLKKRSYWL